MPNMPNTNFNLEENATQKKIFQICQNCRNYEIHINFFKKMPQIMSWQEKSDTHAIKAQKPQIVSKCIKSATN